MKMRTLRRAEGCSLCRQPAFELAALHETSVSIFVYKVEAFPGEMRRRVRSPPEWEPIRLHSRLIQPLRAEWLSGWDLFVLVFRLAQHQATVDGVSRRDVKRGVDGRVEGG